MNKLTSNPIMLNRQQAATRLGIGVRTLDRLVADGEIPTGKLRGRRIFNRELLDRWAEQQCIMDEVV